MLHSSGAAVADDRFVTAHRSPRTHQGGSDVRYTPVLAAEALDGTLAINARTALTGVLCVFSGSGPAFTLNGVVSSALSFDAAGGLWFTYSAAKQLLYLSPDRGLSSVILPDFPESLVAHPDGSVIVSTTAGFLRVRRNGT